jgi:hypothetical protein
MRAPRRHRRIVSKLTGGRHPAISMDQPALRHDANPRGNVGQFPSGASSVHDSNLAEPDFRSAKRHELPNDLISAPPPSALVQHLARIVGVGFGVRGHDNSERRIHACPIRRRDFANEFAFSGLVVQAHQLRRKLAGVVEEQRFSARRPTVEPIIGGYAPDLPRLAPFEG